MQAFCFVSCPGQLRFQKILRIFTDKLLCMYANFTTERLSVSPITGGDTAFIKTIVNSPGWLQFIGDRNIHTEADALAYIQKITDSKAYFYNVVRLKDSEIPIGILSFIKRENQRYYDIGFALLPQYEGKGYVFEAASKYLELIIQAGKHEGVIAITQKDNVRSIALLNRLGLKLVKSYQDENPDLRLYALNLGNSR